VRAASQPYLTLKRAGDILLALAGLVLLSPLLTALWVVVRCESPGDPAIFRQRRAGLGGAPFQLLKLRTMVAGADAMKESLRSRSAVAWPDFNLSDDPRVTRVGRVLRRTSLDELPQLVNVLMGEMSMVGPRPTSFAPETYALWQTERLAYKPGLTGPWQVKGRGSMSFDERSRLEIAFFRNHSLSREWALIPLTAVALVRRTGSA
jgi:lipopolysaccharide/colanic/teichoic acid biosynthesis glycosyltransferase